MKKYKKIFKLFLAGQEDNETKWLSEMSKKGYHLVKVSFATYYTFKKDDPKEYTYIIDMKGNSQIDEGEYVLMYEDYGIEYIDKTYNYYYFRAGNELEIKDIIKNEQGRYLDRMNSHKKILLLGSIVNVLIAIINFYNFNIHHEEQFIWMPYLNLGVGLVCLLAYISMIKKINAMKEKGVTVSYKSNLKDWNGFFEANILLIIALVICIVGFFSIFF